MSSNQRGGTPYYGGIVCSDNKRDLYTVAGFPEELAFDNFYAQFRRNGFAKAAVMRPPQKCWSTSPKIYDFKGKGEPVEVDTPFMQDINYLIEELDLFKWLYALDYRQRVGRYGGIVIVAKEKTGKKSIDELKVTGGVRGIVAFRPVFEGQIEHNDTDYDLSSANYGNPLTYIFKPNNASTSTKSASQGMATLHKSRVFVCAEGADDGSIFGTSCLEAGFNSMMDLFKIQVASAEGFFKNAKQRIHVNIKDEAVASLILNPESDESKDFNKALTELANGFDNEFLTAGMELKVLQSSLTDPTGAANIALQGFCVAVDIPKTILIGMETGELSSSENKSSYNDTMNSRRENFCVKMIIDFINHLIDIGAVRKPTHGIHIYFDDLNTATDGEKFDLASKMTDMNEKSIRSGTGEVFSPDEIREVAGYEKMFSDDIDDHGEEEDSNIEDVEHVEIEKTEE